MPHREPTIRSRELGEGLREAMRQAGLNGKQAAQLLDVTPSYVSMLLAGKRGASELDVAAFLGMCRVTGAERERLLELCREQDTPGWFQQHGARLPKQLVTLIDHENKAVTISEFEAIFVPGLLQTGERDMVSAGPGFVVQGDRPVFIDEYQRVPEILDAIKAKLNGDLRPGASW